MSSAADLSCLFRFNPLTGVGIRNTPSSLSGFPRGTTVGIGIPSCTTDVFLSVCSSIFKEDALLCLLKKNKPNVRVSWNPERVEFNFSCRSCVVYMLSCKISHFNQAQIPKFHRFRLKALDLVFQLFHFLLCL